MTIRTMATAAQEPQSTQLVFSILDDTCRDSILAVALYFDGQMALTDWYSLEKNEVPMGCISLAYAVWALHWIQEHA